MSMTSLGTFASVQDDDEDEHWGSLPARTVQAYDWRVDEICRNLDALDMTELKRYALTAHQMSGGSIDDSISSIGHATDLRRLDDFTALITATILQSLPYLSRLHRLLDVWTTRLSILRQTPAYLRDLKQARMDLDHGWAAIAVSPAVDQSSHAANFTRGTMNEMQSALQRQVDSLGRRLDAFLDVLEGREETVPETWIEDFEILENAYSNWVVQAESKVIENEWRFANEKDHPISTIDRRSERKRQLSYEQEGPQIDGDMVTSTSSQSPNSISVLQHDCSEPYAEPEADRKEKISSEAEGSPSMMSSEQQSPVNEATHKPIVIDRGRSQAVNENETSVLAFDNMATLLSSSPGILGNKAYMMEGEAETSRTLVMKRAAFLNGDIERTCSLQKQSKTPVRPFEHASNAFSRLFRRDKSPGPSRSDSEKSARSVGSRRSKKSDRDNEYSDNLVQNLYKNSTSAPKSNALKDNVERPRSSSRRSVGRVSLQSPLVPISTGGRDIERDYIELPGGFRRRSKSEDDKRITRGRSPAVGRYQHEARGQNKFQCSPVETYQPIRLESPFQPPSSRNQEQPEYPADWPLASPPVTEPTSPVKDGDLILETNLEYTTCHNNDRNTERANDASSINAFNSEIHTPAAPIATDAFDRMFVQSFPGMLEAGETSRGEVSQNLCGRGKKEKKADEHMVGDKPLQKLRTPDKIEIMRRKDEQDEEHWEKLSLTLYNSRVPNSDRSRCEGLDEIAIDDAATQPPPTSLRGSLCTDQQIPKVESPGKTSLKLIIPDPQILAGPGMIGHDHNQDEEKSYIIKHALMANIETHPRTNVRSIHVSRRSSVGSIINQSATQSLRGRSSVPAFKSEGTRTPTSPLGYKGLIFFPSPPTSRSGVPISPENAGSAKQPAQIIDSNAPKENMESPVSDKVEEDMPSPAPLNSAMVKRRVKEPSKNFLHLPPTDSVEPMTPSEDTFDRHVSEVIQRLPSAAIKFKARPGAETPVAFRTSEPRTYTSVRPKNGRVLSRTNPGGLTLAPAEPSPKKSTTDSEVKLYHLTQAGRDEPIKLFVRLVGDGERVMVRVGGGWADLADYLRQYAEHHGSRTVSGSSLEVHTAESAGPSSRRVSGSSAIFEAKAGRMSAGTVASQIVPRPMSRAATPGADEDWLSQPQPKFTMGDDTDEESSPVLVRSHSPTSVNGTSRSTPRSTTSASRPSTADSTKRPVSRQGWNESGSLAGLGSAGKRSDMTEQKAKWVEDMIEKAKASAEKSRDEKGKYFGELGKVGGTRRVVFRANTGVTNSAGGDCGRILEK